MCGSQHYLCPWSPSLLKISSEQVSLLPVTEVGTTRSRTRSRASPYSCPLTHDLSHDLAGGDELHVYSELRLRDPPSSGGPPVVRYRTVYHRKGGAHE
jgi:hypothetical protein